VTDPARMPVKRSAAPEPKTATVERREASVPRHKRVHARLDALWDARRLAGRLACGVIARRTGAAAPERLSALRHPSIGAWRSKDAKAWAQKLRRGNEEDWLFDK
jgi:hypothetical protein